MTASVQKLILLQGALDRLTRKEQDLKKAGAYAEAAGVRDSIVTLLRLADEEPQQPPMESSDEPT